MSTALEQSDNTETPILPLSNPAPSDDFAGTVDWNNPRVSAILKTAASCFAERGFAHTTLADIGEELKLRKSIVHYYFASKARLISEVQNFAYGQSLSVFHQAFGEKSLTSLHAPSSKPSPPPSVVEPTAIESSLEEAAQSQDPLILEKVQTESAHDAVVPPRSATRAKVDQESEPKQEITKLQGLRNLWRLARREHAIRALHLEFWSLKRHDTELSSQAELYESKSQEILEKYFMQQHRATQDASQDLASLTLAVLDGMNVRENMHPKKSARRNDKSFKLYLELLDRAI